jgi:hypothetical protein
MVVVGNVTVVIEIHEGVVRGGVVESQRDHHQQQRENNAALPGRSEKGTRVLVSWGQYFRI